MEEAEWFVRLGVSRTFFPPLPLGLISKKQPPNPSSSRLLSALDEQKAAASWALISRGAMRYSASRTPGRQPARRRKDKTASGPCVPSVFLRSTGTTDLLRAPAPFSAKETNCRVTAAVPDTFEVPVMNT